MSFVECRFVPLIDSLAMLVNGGRVSVDAVWLGIPSRAQTGLHPRNLSIAVKLAQDVGRHTPGMESRATCDWETVRRRDAVLDAGRVTGISHEHVMETARKSLRCE